MLLCSCVNYYVLNHSWMMSSLWIFILKHLFSYVLDVYEVKFDVKSQMIETAKLICEWEKHFSFKRNIYSTKLPYEYSCHSLNKAYCKLFEHLRNIVIWWITIPKCILMCVITHIYLRFLSGAYLLLTWSTVIICCNIL